MIRVLIVEDSAVIREFLVYVLSGDAGIEIAGTANNGEEAIEAVKLLKPDVITMDIHMPRMDGFEATRRIMEMQPTPIVIVSGSTSTGEVAATFRAIEAGALAIMPRPRGVGDSEFERTAKELVQTVKLMAEVKVVRRWAKREAPVPPSPPEARRGTADIRVVAIGASTGGPQALQAILSRLPKDFPVPVLVVQHMAPGFLGGFVEWLAGTTGFSVRVAASHELPAPSRAYVAPDGVHMEMRGDRIELVHAAPDNGLRPSVANLFRSVADTFGRHAAGVLLTGMGKDGAAELKLMREKGAVTIAQDRDSSVVYGMPGEAAKLGAAACVLPLGGIAPALVNLVGGK